MENLKNKIAVLIESGEFTELGVTLAKSFKKVYSFIPWNTSGFPSNRPALAGLGFEGITRINYLFAQKDRDTDYEFDKVDIFISPELYFYDIEIHLRSIGKRVWGSGEGQWLELDRFWAKSIMKQNNIPVNQTVQKKGITKLKQYLKGVENVYVKISHWRPFETFKHEDYKLSEYKLNFLESKIGPAKDEPEFTIETSIDAILEPGIDTYIVDGQFPDKCLVGIEIKDKCYAGRMVEYDKLPKIIKLCTDNLSDFFKKTMYRNFYSNEIKIDKKKIPYPIDHTTRGAAPPLALMTYLITNLSEIIWNGAEGILIQPKFAYEYGIQLIGNIDFLENNFCPVYFPASLRENIKFRFGMKVENMFYCIPQPNESTECIDIVIGGNSFDECFKKAKKIADQVEAYSLCFNVDALEKVQEEIEKSKKIGLNLE